MRAITVYEATDGRRFDDPAKAVAHDAFCSEVAVAMAPLGALRSLGPGEFIQHDPGTVRRVRVAVLDIASANASATMREKYHEIIDMITSDPEFTGNHSMVARHLEGDGPLVRAWFRLECIAANGREYQQPYYTTHQDEAAQDWARHANRNTNKE